MSTIISPNMSLPVPAVGTEQGPNYALDINNCMNILDGHTHAAGSGVPITPGAININSALTFNSNFGINIGGLTLTAQSVTPANNTVYESGTDLYFVDGLGNNVRLTQSGGVAGSPGSISNLTPPASATYVAGSDTFVWQSGVSQAANMDAASYLFRNITPNSTFAVTLQPVNALGSNYSLTLPTLPPQQQIMTLDAAGIIGAPYTVDGSSIVINANVIQIGTLPANSVGTSQLIDNSVTQAKMTSNSVGTPQLIDGAVTYAKLAGLNVVAGATTGAFFYNGGTPTPMTGVVINATGLRPILVALVPDGSSNFSYIAVGASAVNSGASITIVRNASPIGNYFLRNDSTTLTVSWPASSVWILDTSPPAGAVSYSIQVQNNGAAFLGNYLRAIAIEL